MWTLRAEGRFAGICGPQDKMARSELIRGLAGRGVHRTQSLARTTTPTSRYPMTSAITRRSSISVLIESSSWFPHLHQPWKVLLNLSLGRSALVAVSPRRGSASVAWQTFAARAYLLARSLEELNKKISYWTPSGVKAFFSYLGPIPFPWLHPPCPVASQHQPSPHSEHAE